MVFADTLLSKLSAVCVNTHMAFSNRAANNFVFLERTYAHLSHRNVVGPSHFEVCLYFLTLHLILIFDMQKNIPE